MHRRSGLLGLLTGGAYGLVAFLNREMVEFAWLPEWFTGQWEAFLWSMLFTAAGLALASAGFGRQEESAGQVPRAEGWLRRSTEELGEIRLHPFDKARPALDPRWYALALGVACVAMILVFW